MILLRSKEYWSLIETGIIVAPVNATQEQLNVAEESKLKDLKAKKLLVSNRREYFSRTLAIANKMSAHGDTMTQGTIVEKILHSLTSRFNYVVCSIEEANDVTTMIVDQLQSSLLVQEQIMKNQKEEEQFLKVSHGGRGYGREDSSNRARGSRGRERGGRGGRSFNKENVECYRCHKLGHFQSECPSWEEDNANYAQFDEDQEIFLMAQDTKSGGENHMNHELWFLDSGCSNHMVGNKSWLFDHDDTFKDSVKLGPSDPSDGQF
ncbi:hypothetical protein TSUD_244210 [Trifolium subterraneum]|uniref:CCHC-type domain-containing protein n=1 Tax=Trifolium subterraneum TaxID=3900 RepID=A0A2Z6NNQ3_TRISU|nr:hypothetical protein TSUD_244210 [Trifolium subterraneum]